jgi:hypothetical protein
MYFEPVLKHPELKNMKYILGILFTLTLASGCRPTAKDDNMNDAYDQYNPETGKGTYGAPADRNDSMPADKTGVSGSTGTVNPPVNYGPTGVTTPSGKR